MAPGVCVDVEITTPHLRLFPLLLLLLLPFILLPWIYLLDQNFVFPAFFPFSSRLFLPSFPVSSPATCDL
jgi:hypothetical protein